MANTQDESELAESYNEGNIDMLPQPEDRFTIKNLLFPSNTEPSALSGFAVNICTSVLGERRVKAQRQVSEKFTWCLMFSVLWFYFFFHTGVLVCVFSIVAVQGGLAPWSLAILSVIMLICLIITAIVCRQPQSKTKLAFKVKCVVSGS